ncbi:MAG: sigma-70 family RNA polymerase sigma factor [Planctomycetes bacterium]|nr:sigma-70 family RNA polymerase sigma factor [Planctomycetota bacterium]
MQPIDAAGEFAGQRDALRRLAAALLGDTHAAEDVVQEAFTAALERRPEPAILPHWLRAVVRRLAVDRHRRSVRRRARERTAARDEAVEADESLERLELVAALVDEVRELDEPFRTVVRLRYFDALEPRAIAERLGVPLATVESRLARARSRLRERLDRRGGREKWLAATAAWVHPMEVPWMELAIVKTVTKIGAATAVLLLAWWSWNAWSSNVGSPSSDTRASTPLEAPKGDFAAAEPSSAHEQRAEVVAPTAEPATPESAPSTKLAGLVLDADGKSVADVEVGFVAEGELDASARLVATSGADGRFEFVEPAVSGSLRALGERWFTLGAAPIGPLALPCDRVVCVAAREPLFGVVVDSDGVPLGGVRVEFGQLRGLRTLPVPTHDLPSIARATVSAADGSYRFDDAPLVHDLGVRATRRGSSIVFHATLGDLRANSGRIVFAYDDAPAFVLHGVVVDEREQPIEGAFLMLVPKQRPPGRSMRVFPQVRSDARGAFEFPLFRGQPDMVITAGASGRELVTLTPTGDSTLAASWPEPLVVRLDRPAPKLRGRVVDEQGRPLTDAWVDVLDGTPWGVTRMGEGYLDASGDCTWEQLAAGRTPWTHVDVDAAGGFELRELQPRAYRVVAFDRQRQRWALSEPVQAGSSGVELVIDTTNSEGRVAGRVVDSSGAPIAGALVTLDATAPDWLERFEAATLYGIGASRPVLTDSDGRFELNGVGLELRSLRAEPPSARWFAGRKSLANVTDRENVEIVLPRVAFVRVELSEAACGPGLEPMDMDVVPVDVRGRQLERTLLGLAVQARFDDTRRTGVFPVCDTASALVVQSNGDVLLTIPVELEAGKVNVIRK